MAVELRKGQKVNLSKNADKPLGEILINLNWSQPPAKKFLGLTLPQQSIDLDLGCLYEMKNGKKGCVQALGKMFGSLQGFPYIALDGDDRSGAASDGENLHINGAHISEFKRILIYTFIYEGAANWRSADGVVTVKCPGSQDLIVRMDEYGSALKMCAIAMLENSNNETFSVEKLVQFYDGHIKMDRTFNWGMNWTPGRKD
ncbi:MAG: TerD family protein [Oscillospiraceae bacterium]|nr:TerD family protein [Oscillospiraceae bacterium]